jgi:hypothetical protein
VIRRFGEKYALIRPRQPQGKGKYGSKGKGWLRQDRPYVFLAAGHFDSRPISYGQRHTTVKPLSVVHYRGFKILNLLVPRKEDSTMYCIDWLVLAILTAICGITAWLILRQ